jgi:hypothetical protein
VNFLVDAHAISFASENDNLHHASVECVVQVYTPKGKPVKSEGSTITASLKPETFQKMMQQGAFPCQQRLDLPVGNYLLRLGVRDNSTGLIGTTNARVTVAQTTPIPSTSNEQKP